VSDTPAGAGESGAAETGSEAAAGAGGPDADAATEGVDELRHEVDELRKQLADAKAAGASAEAGATPTGKRRLRSVAAVILIVLGSVLAPIAGITVFVRNQVLNTDRYVSNIAPLSKNPAIASVMATQVTNQLFSHFNVQSEIASVLPPKADFIAAPLSNAIKSQTYNIADKVISSNQFNQVWVAMNRQVHTALVSVLTGNGPSALKANQNGTVSLDLHALAQNVITQLDSRGITVFDKLPISKINLQIVLLQSRGLVKAQQATKLLNHLALFLPFLAIACYAGAVAVSTRRRRALMWCGIGLAVSMAVLAIILGLARSFLISASAGHALTPEASAALFDTLLRYLRTGLRVLFGIGVLVALGAWLAGPSRPVVALRRAVVRAYRWVEQGVRNRGWDFGPVGQWVAANKGVVQGVLVGLAVLVLVWWGNPGILGTLVVLLVTGFLVVVVRTLAVKPRLPGGASTGPGAGPGGAGPTTPTGPAAPTGGTGAGATA